MGRAPEGGGSGRSTRRGGSRLVKGRGRGGVIDCEDPEGGEEGEGPGEG